jgi:hypothetical protein
MQTTPGTGYSETNKASSHLTTLTISDRNLGLVLCRIWVGTLTGGTLVLRPESYTIQGIRMYLVCTLDGSKV